MEWMLQVVDEIDDTVGALRLCCTGIREEIALAAAGFLGIAAISLAIVKSAEVPLFLIAAIVLSLGTGLKIRGQELKTAG
jgi:hypothetical protein